MRLHRAIAKRDMPGAGVRTAEHIVRTNAWRISQRHSAGSTERVVVVAGVNRLAIVVKQSNFVRRWIEKLLTDQVSLLITVGNALNLELAPLDDDSVALPAPRECLVVDPPQSSSEIYA